LEGGSSSSALPWGIIVRGSLGKGEILKPLGLVRISVGIDDQGKEGGTNNLLLRGLRVLLSHCLQELFGF
jgi:hypothetical protein